MSLARRRRGKTKGQLATAISASPRIITAYESSEKQPSARSLRELSDALRFPVEFFGGSEPEEPPLEGSSFRALSSATARDRGQALASGALALSLSDWIAERFDLPDPDIPQHELLDPETAAIAVRSEWGMGERSVGNIIHLLESRGVRMFSLAEDSRAMDAFSFWRGGVPYIFLNTSKSTEHTRMDVAHELGHLVLHRKHGGVRGRESEQDAQRFASAFLMPKATVIAETGAAYNLEHLKSIKRHWNVALSALVYRMHQVDVLSEWHYRTLFIEIAQRGYRKKEPNPCPVETSQVLGKVFQSLRADGVTMVDVARALAIYPEELSLLVFGLVIAALDGAASTRTVRRPPDWAMPYLERA